MISSLISHSEQSESQISDLLNFQLQDGIQIPLEQQLQSMPWILNTNTTNIVTEEHNSIPQRLVKKLSHFFLSNSESYLNQTNNNCVHSKGKLSAQRVLHLGATQDTLEQGSLQRLRSRVKIQAFLMI